MQDDKEFLKLFRERKPRNMPLGMWQTGTECLTLVIGNGFDLQCGLKTTYNDFFDYSVEEVVGNNDRIYDTIQTTFRNKRGKKYKVLKIRDLYRQYNEYLSVWDIYFIYTEIRTDCWADIEKLMRKSLVDDGFWDKVDERFCELFINKNKRNKVMKSHKLDLYDFLASLIFERYYMMDNTTIGKPDWEEPEEIFYDKLLEELNIFEKRFGRYVKNQYEENKEEYIRVSRENIKRIYDDGVERSNLNITNCILRIISFNYIPLIDEDILNKNEKYIHYMHCDLDNPIFCIDKVGNRDNPKAEYYNKFSNENRELKLGVYNINDIFNTEIQAISVLTYGLSFSNVDATDFEKIFLKKDSGLYSKDDFQQTICYYPDMGKDKKNETRNFLGNMTTNLEKLIKKFSGSISFTSLVRGSNEKIRTVPIKLTKIKK